MNDLVQRLSHDQPVRVSLRPQATAEAFKAALERGYVHILFTETRGGTELGVRLDPPVDLRGADFAARTGTVQLTGELVLDYERVRLHAALDVATLAGTGRLEALATPSAATEGGVGNGGSPSAGATT